MTFFTQLPNFLCLLEPAPLFHWHLTKNMHSSLFYTFFTHTHFLPGHHFECSRCRVSKLLTWRFIETFLPQHTTFVNTSSITNSPFFVEVHGYKCFLIFHFTQTTVILWWEKLQLGISRFQSLITCFEQIVFKFLLIHVWTSRRLKRLRVYFVSLTR